MPRTATTTRLPKLARASYYEACAWIAYNDNEADGPDEALIGGYLTVALVADIFVTTTDRVATEVARVRVESEKRHRLVTRRIV